MAIEIRSSAFEEGGPIPSKYTCDGEDVSPALHWEGVPPGARSIVLIADDPDAPMGTWVHWVLYGLPAEFSELEEALPADERLSNGAVQGTNDFDRIGYGGPCPPPGKPHRYYFKIYALSQKLEMEAGAEKPDVVDAMEGLVLDEGSVVGTYQR